jgi:DHA1 family bicyclomycin/chloramphenicol resistance-like MFS transporter
VLQFALGAIVAPIVGIAGSTSALPMAVVIAFLGISALTTVEKA